MSTRGKVTTESPLQSALNCGKNENCTTVVTVEFGEKLEPVGPNLTQLTSHLRHTIVGGVLWIFEPHNDRLSGFMRNEESELINVFTCDPCPIDPVTIKDYVTTRQKLTHLS